MQLLTRRVTQEDGLDKSRYLNIGHLEREEVGNVRKGGINK